MNPEKYIEIYTAPLTGGPGKPAQEPGPDRHGPLPDPDALPFLPAERYHSAHEPAPYMYSFTMDKLTREELLRMVTETGIGDPANVTPGQLIGWIREKDRTIAEQGSLLAERDGALEEQARIFHSRQYRVFRMLLLPARMLRRAARYAGRFSGRPPGR